VRSWRAWLLTGLLAIAASLSSSAASAADDDPAYNIAGVAPGMKRAAISHPLPRGVHVQYDATGTVVGVLGKSLRDGGREVVTPASRAGDVRQLFGDPDREVHDHVIGKVGGFFWHYHRQGVVIVFSFTDDLFRLRDRAPLFEVRLLSDSR